MNCLAGTLFRYRLLGSTKFQWAFWIVVSPQHSTRSTLFYSFFFCQWSGNADFSSLIRPAGFHSRLFRRPSIVPVIINSVFYSCNRNLCFLMFGLKSSRTSKVSCRLNERKSFWDLTDRETRSLFLFSLRFLFLFFSRWKNLSSDTLCMNDSAPMQSRHEVEIGFQTRTGSWIEWDTMERYSISLPHTHTDLPFRKEKENCLSFHSSFAFRSAPEAMETLAKSVRHSIWKGHNWHWLWQCW